MDTIQLPIQPVADMAKLDALIERLEGLQAKGYKIPVEFVGNIEALQAQLNQLAASAPKMSVPINISAPIEEAGVFTSSLITKLKAVGETGAAEKLSAGFRTLASEVVYLDGLYDQMTVKMRAAARNPQNLISGQMYEWEAVLNLIAQRQSQLAQVPREQMDAPRDKAMFDEARSARSKAAAASTDVAKGEAAAGESTAKTLPVINNATEAYQRLAEATRQAAAAQRQLKAAGGGLPPGAVPPGGGGRGGAAGAGAGGKSLFPDVLGTIRSATVFIGVYRALDEVIRAMEFGVESAVKYERQLATLSIVYRGTTEEARALGLAVLDQASALGQDGIKALEVATDFARYGFTQSEVLEAVRVSAIAANVAQLDLGESSRALQAILSGYQLNVGQLAGVLGSLDTVSHSYNVTNRQLLDGLSRVAPLAKQAGISLNELVGFEAVISGRTARPGAEAGNAIKSLISRLTKPQVQAALGDIGVNVLDQTGELKNASAIINEVFLAYQNLSRGEQQELLVKIAGTQQASRIAALLEGYVKSQQLAIAASRDLTRADRENIAVRATLSSQLGTLSTEWQKFFVGAGGAGATAGIQTQLRDIIKNLGDVLGLFNSLQQFGAKNQPSAVNKVLGSRTFDQFLQMMPGPVGLPAAARESSRQIEDFRKFMGDRFKTDIEKAGESLIKFNAEIEKFEKLGEADTATARLLRTISQSINSAAPDKLENMLRVAAQVSEPTNLPKQEALRTQLQDLARSGDYTRLNAALEELHAQALARSNEELQKANTLLGDRITKESAHLTELKTKREQAARGGRAAESETLDKQIEQSEAALESLRQRQGTVMSNLFPEGDEPYASAALNLDKVRTAVSSIAQKLAQTRSTTKQGELDSEVVAANLTLELEKRKIDALVQRGGVSRRVADDAIKDLTRERDETLQNIEFARMYADMIDRQAQAHREAALSSKAFRDAQSEAEDLARERAGLLGGARREPVTGIALNIAAARQDLGGAKSPEERAAALARLSEFGSRLEELGLDILSRKLALEADITREREKQSLEASKNLLMADRETQLRAALAAKLIEQRGGRAFNAAEFGFLDTKDKQAIEKGFPSGLPAEAQTKLSELTREYAVAREELSNYSATLAEGRKIQAEASKQLQELIEKFNPASKDQSGGAAGGVFDMGTIAKAMDAGSRLIQGALDDLGQRLEARDATFAGAIAALGDRVGRVERGSLQGAIGRAQGAAANA
jgi:TP901 family phage tail tape measure protein